MPDSPATSPIRVNIEGNITKPIEKLIDVVASGVGSVAGHWFSSGRTKADANYLRVMAQAQKDAQDIASGKKQLTVNGNLVVVENTDSQKISANSLEEQTAARLNYQEIKRQKNIIDIIDKTKEKLPESVSEEEVDQDWIARYFSYAQDISTEEMQNIWAKILAGEVEKPRRVSMRTLDCLKNITKGEAELFEKIKPLIVENYILRSIFQNKNHEGSRYGVSFEQIMKLQHAGLIDPNWSLSKNFIPTDVGNHKLVTVSARLGRNTILIAHKKSDSKFSIPVVILTDAGCELLEATGREEINDEYLNEFETLLSGFEIQRIGYTQPTPSTS